MINYYVTCKTNFSLFTCRTLPPIKHETNILPLHVLLAKSFNGKPLRCKPGDKMHILKCLNIHDCSHYCMVKQGLDGRYVVNIYRCIYR